MNGDPPKTVINFPKMPKLPVIPTGGLKAVLLIILAVILLATSIYQIEPEEVGVVLRLGKFSDITEPGLHFKIPFGVDRVFKVAVQRQLKQEFGFRTTAVDVRSRVERVPNEADMLTGDLNAAIVEWVVQYRVVDAQAFLFNIRNVEETFRDMSEAVMRQVVGDRTVNEVLTVGRSEIENLVKVDLQALSQQYETGIRVEQVVLQDVNPPDPVKPSFNEVNQAEQERERLINEAQSEYNKVVPRAQGEARQTIQQAEGYGLNRVNHAEGNAARFNALYSEYRKAPEVTRTRIYLETLAEALPQAGSKIVVDSDLEGILPLLNLTGGQPGGGGDK
ncbi:MAG: FtsH protease activity modulator HflK [Thermoanaerobaculia bacterium]